MSAPSRTPMTGIPTAAPMSGGDTCRWEQRHLGWRPTTSNTDADALGTPSLLDETPP